MNTLFASNRPATRTASTLRLSTVASLAGVFALSLAGTAANAQTYIGNAYDVGTNVGVGVLGIPLASVGATLSDTGALPSAGGAQSATLLGANANVNVALIIGSFSAVKIDGNPAANAVVATASTAGNGGGISAGNILSTSTISNVDLFTNLLTATALTSTTTANYASSSEVGNSSILGLKLDGTTINFSASVPNVSTPIDITAGAGGSITVGTGPNQEIDLVSLGVVDAKLILNEQVFNGAGDALTTNAIDLSVNVDPLSVAGVGGKVIVASSTAGFVSGSGGAAAAAPEPGSMPLIAAGIPFLLGGIRVGRRKLAKLRGNAS